MKIPVEEQYKFVKLSLPDGSKADGQAVLLHACCAPCSSAIVECMLRNGMKPTVYFSNSNIYPQQEFEIRKHELMRFLRRRACHTWRMSTTMRNGLPTSRVWRMNQKGEAAARLVSSIA